MKQAVVIINPYSGKRKAKETINESSSRCLSLFKRHGYEVTFHKTTYPGHATDIVKNLSDTVDLVISVGGDGTLNEAMVGNFARKKRLVLAHLPYGTTNDIGAMFGFGKHPYKNLQLILSGIVKGIDICTINGHPFVYSAGFGKFMNVPYETGRNLKKYLGKSAYIIAGLRDFFQKKTPLYELTYEVDGEKYHGLYSFALISNANRIAGMPHFYRNVKLNDNAFEVAFCNLRTKRDIVRSLIYLRLNDITKVPGFYFHKTDHIRIKFHSKLKKPWCLDGELYRSEDDVYDIKIERNVPMIVAEHVIDKMFLSED
ncbi:MAG: hypothetical protein HFG40_04945 [Bacilli bacterium]|nr:hypothetical protein [Bacilli bacterium]